MRQIIVEPSELLRVANKIESLKDEYRNLYLSLYSKIDDLSNSWQGKDNTAYANQIRTYEENFRRIAIIMSQYSDFIKNTTKAYESTQNELYNQANSLNR